MPHFTIPAAPEHLPVQSFSLALEKTLAISDEAYAAICHRMGGAAASSHVAIREPVSVGGTSAEIRGFIGLHPRPNEAGEDTDQLQQRSPWLHYSLELRPVRRAEAATEADWQTISSALAEVLGTHTINFSSTVWFERKDVVLAVSLPIELGPSEVPGFSEIKGVRLSKADPENSSEDLYSAIIDNHDKYVYITVTATIESPFDEDVLVRAFDRVSSITDLLVKRVEQHDKSN